MDNIKQGCLEVLKQGENYLKSVDKESYTAIIQPYFTSSPGEHIRHILDMFLAVLNSDNNEIDYDQRNRGSEIETHPSSALEQLLTIKTWVESLIDSDFENIIKMKTEVSVIEKRVSESTTTLGRELIFCASHAVHHFAIIAIAAKMKNVEVENGFGLAPATVTYLRETCN